MDIRIPDGNPFRIRLAARNLITGEYTEAADLGTIKSLVINYVRRGIRFAQQYTIDEEDGTALISNQGTLDCGIYGIELTGYYAGDPVRYYGKDVFEVTNETTDITDVSEDIDIEILMKLIASGVSKQYVDYAIKEKTSAIETEIESMGQAIELAGKVDDVKVNGSSVVDQKVANINIPTKTSDLSNDSDYITSDQAQAKVNEAKINSATATYTDDGGNPEATAEINNNNLNIHLKNLKLKFSDLTEDERQAITGPQGTQGDSFQPIEDVSGLVLAHTIGQDNTKAMSQKGVTDAVDGICEFQEMTLTVINKAGFVNGEVIVAASGSSTQRCWWAAVKAGDIIKINASNSTSVNMRYAYSDVAPAIGVELTGKTTLSGTSIDAYIDVPSDGYIVINHGYDVFTDKTVKIRRIPSASEVDSKASKKNMSDVMAITNIISAESDVEREETIYNYINTNGGMGQVAGTNARIYEFEIEGDRQYHIIGRVGGVNYVGYAFYAQDGSLIAYGERGEVSVRNFSANVSSPENARILRVASNTGFPESNAKVSEIVAATTEEQKADVRDKLGITGNTIKTIHPKMTRDYLNVYGGIGHGTTTQVDVRCVVSTARFVKVSGSVTLTTANDRYVRLERYNSSFGFISYSDINVIANEETELSLGSAAYIKIMMAETSACNTQIPMEEISLKGNFGNDWDVFNIRSSDSGYQRIAVAVNTTDPNSCDDETDDIQDMGTLERDYGVIVLPERYQNIGEPTRLIIYCHGAAVNYGWSNTRFNEQDLEPDYWLAEGYAVMDIEGNPYDNNNEHFYMPQAMECYIAAYKWAIEHYNLRRDGVFIGGRSMGGGMTFNLIRRECPIPVIAACPNVPASIPTFYWNYMDSERRTFCARKYGLIGENETMTGTSPMPANEWQILKDNFDKMVKYSPIWSLITDLPSKEMLMDDKMNISKDASYNEDEENLYASLHMKVKAPVKIFAVKDDTTCYYRRTAVLVYKMLRNGGNIVELRMFQSGNHHADTQNPAMRTDVTTRYGETLENIPVVYVEMLKFWRRFEQE